MCSSILLSTHLVRCDCVTRQVDEGVYHGQTQMLSHLLKELIQSDTTESGMLTNQEFR